MGIEQISEYVWNCMDMIGYVGLTGKGLVDEEGGVLQHACDSKTARGCFSEI